MKNAFLFLCITCTFVTSYGQGENLFDDTYLHEIRFENADTNIYITTKNYQQVKVYIDGNLVDSIGCKKKGNISGYPSTNKYGMKIKTNKYVSGKKYDGVKEFSLNMNYQDPTMMREKLTFELCEQLGLYSLRTAFAKVYINDLYWGVFTIVESKDEMFKRRFDDRNADAIESLDFGTMCFISNNPDDYNADIVNFPYYQIENGEETTAFERFALMIDKANNTADATYVEEVSGHLNLKDFFRYQAANVYLMNFDAYIGLNGNQIYMYDTLESVWQVIPWDFNASLNLWDNGNGNQLANSYPLFPERITEGCIAEKLNTQPTLKNYYLNAMCELANDLADTTIIFNRIAVLKEQIQAAVFEDSRTIYTAEEFEQTTGFGYFSIDFNQFEGLKTFFMERNTLIKQQLEVEGFTCGTTGFAPTPQEINDIKVYPNPASTFLHIEGKKSIEEILFYDLQGRVVKHVNMPTTLVDIKDLKEGIYFVSIRREGKMFLARVVVAY